ncbi:peroxisomal assembly protein [Podochytrium sp. JEL0797]|nr:peroxisomal assembly protein [Podochytrium sp. JEL0797]
MHPCVFVMRNVDALVGGVGGDQNEEKAARALMSAFLGKGGVAVVGTTGEAEKVWKEVRSGFGYEVELPMASDELRHKIVSELTNKVSLSNDIDQKKLAIQTSGLCPADLVALVARALLISGDGVAGLYVDPTLAVKIALVFAHIFVCTTKLNESAVSERTLAQAGLV